jgi:glutaminyl-tRNA synthetase
VSISENAWAKNFPDSSKMFICVACGLYLDDPFLLSCSHCVCKIHLAGKSSNDPYYCGKCSEFVTILFSACHSKFVITNYPERQTDLLKGENNPEDPESSFRDITFSREIFIEREDFMEDAPAKFFRMKPGGDIRLKHAYILHCTDVKKDEDGIIQEIYVTYYPNSKSGEDVSGIKPKGTLHWVNASDAFPCEIRDYDRLFTVPDPTEDDKDFLELYNQDSLSLNTNALMERSLASASVGQHYQFFRKGYYMVDPDSTTEKPVFNLTVGLKDSFSKQMQK